MEIVTELEEIGESGVPRNQHATPVHIDSPSAPVRVGRLDRRYFELCPPPSGYRNTRLPHCPNRTSAEAPLQE